MEMGKRLILQTTEVTFSAVREKTAQGLLVIVVTRSDINLWHFHIREIELYQNLIC